MQFPTSAPAFEAWMNEQVWAMIGEPAPDGSLTIYGTQLLDRFENANDAAKACGAYRTGSTKIHDEWWQVYRFPDHSGIAIRKDGSAITQVGQGFRRRRRA